MGTDRRMGLLGTMCLFAAGCFSYGPYGQPGTFAPPHTAMAPRPYATVQGPPGAVWVPASPTASNALSAPQPIRKSAATSFEDDHEPANVRTVPEPTDPAKAQPEESDSYGFNGDEHLNRPSVTVGQRARPKPLVDGEFTSVPSSLALESAEPEISIAEDDDPRLPRSGVRSAEFRTQVRTQAITPVSASAAKFGYDAEAYSWLQGIIEFDAKHKVWHLTYSDSPDDSDQFGGEVTLKNSQHFKTLRNGQAVSVQGQFDPTLRDRLGKPVYEVSELHPAGKR